MTRSGNPQRDPKDRIKTSVIIPVYNTEEWLPACLDSVLTQTQREIEVILVDDGSTDGSPAIERAYAERDPRVRMVPLNTPYRDVFAQSALVLTDYSSAVFDFAYLRKPVLYCQFDKEEFFAGGHVYTPGYFSYERDGFGEVEYTLEDTINRIIEYVRNGCKMKDEYRRRADAFFAFNDQNNCARVAEKIEQLANKTQ